MTGVTVNVLVEITKDGKTNTYKASNGTSLTGVVTEKDVMNLVNFGAKQILAEAHVDTEKHLNEIQAQDALEID